MAPPGSPEVVLHGDRLTGTIHYVEAEDDFIKLLSGIASLPWEEIVRILEAERSRSIEFASLSKKAPALLNFLQSRLQLPQHLQKAADTSTNRAVLKFLDPDLAEVERQPFFGPERDNAGSPAQSGCSESKVFKCFAAHCRNVVVTAQSGPFCCPEHGCRLDECRIVNPALDSHSQSQPEPSFYHEPQNQSWRRSNGHVGTPGWSQSDDRANSHSSLGQLRKRFGAGAPGDFQGSSFNDNSEINGERFQPGTSSNGLHYCPLRSEALLPGGFPPGRHSSRRALHNFSGESQESQQSQQSQQVADWSENNLALVLYSGPARPPHWHPSDLPNTGRTGTGRSVPQISPEQHGPPQGEPTSGQRGGHTEEGGPGEGGPDRPAVEGRETRGGLVQSDRFFITDELYCFSQSQLAAEALQRLRPAEGGGQLKKVTVRVDRQLMLRLLHSMVSHSSSVLSDAFGSCFKTGRESLIVRSWQRMVGEINRGCPNTLTELATQSVDFTKALMWLLVLLLVELVMRLASTLGMSISGKVRHALG